MSIQEIKALRDGGDEWLANITELDKMSGLKAEGGRFYCGIHREMLTETVQDLCDTAIALAEENEKLKKEAKRPKIKDMIAWLRGLKVEGRDNRKELWYFKGALSRAVSALMDLDRARNELDRSLKPPKSDT
jgi:hypothetical protein